MGHHIEPAFGGHLFAFLWNERDLVGLHAAGDRNHLGGNRSLEIELHLHGLPQDLKIAILNMPPVLSQMDRDAIGATELGHRRPPNRIRLDGLSSLPDGGDMVDVHTKCAHTCLPDLSPP